MSGNLNANNQPLVQTFAWPKDASGNYLPLDQFPKSAGHSADDAQLSQRASGSRSHGSAARCRAPAARCRCPASCRSVSCSIPAPWGTRELNNKQRRRASAHERELNAKFLTYFADLVYDANPDFTMKNQLFFDSIDQYKISNQPM